MSAFDPKWTLDWHVANCTRNALQSPKGRGRHTLSTVYRATLTPRRAGCTPPPRLYVERPGHSFPETEHATPSYRTCRRICVGAFFLRCIRRSTTCCDFDAADDIHDLATRSRGNKHHEYDHDK